MEPISFALALAGIPGIFTSCVECYKYIQFGREFEADLEMSLCKLDAAEMRLTRWGASMGIDGPDTKLRSGAYSEDEIKKAYHWLTEIRKAFDSAMETSFRYKRTVKPDKLQLLDTDAEIHKQSGSLQMIHTRIRTINDKRVKPRKRDRVAWALYRKGNFENLLESISDLTNNLVELFPSTVESQRQMCKEEVQDLDVAALALLNKAVGDEDAILAPILRAEAERRPNVFSNIDVRDDFRGHFGDNVAPGEKSRSGLYSDIIGGGSATAHFGSNIGNFQGRTVFDSVDGR
jgi:hypothetical protein